MNTRGKLVDDMGACTGVFVAPQIVLTAAHCLSKSTGHQWIRENNGKAWEASILASVPKEDLALLHVIGKPHMYTKIGKSVHKTERVYTVNSGQDFQDTYGEGVVENIVSLEEIQSPGILHSIAIFGGASGSGLFNRKGQLIGINIMKQGAISWAVNTPTIIHFLHDNNVN